MMLKKISLFGLAFMAGSAFAAPVVNSTPVVTIDVDLDGADATPITVGSVLSGIDYDVANDTIYFTTIGNRRIGKIVDPTGVATVSIFANSSDADAPAGPVTWPASRGLQNVKVDQSNGNVLASGDQGTNGAVLLYDSSGTLIDSVLGANQIGGANRRTAGADFYGTGFVTIETVTKVVTNVNSTLDTDLGSPVTPTALYGRSIEAFGDDLYLGLASNASPELVAKLSGGTPAAFASHTITEPFYTHNFAVSSAIRWTMNGWSFDGADYVLVSDATNREVLIIEAAGGALDQTLDNTSHGIVNVGGAVGFNKGGQDYIAVSQDNASLDAQIAIYAVNTGSNVENWSLYSN